MKKEPKIFLEHIKESLQEITNYSKGLTKAEFFSDKKTQDAIIRRFEIIGEAIRNLPLDLKNKNRNIKWREVADMRNKLIHEYFGVDLNSVWETIKKDVPKLKKEIKQMLEKF